MRLNVWLRLGRVSNLPTVWTNALAGSALASLLFAPMHAALLGFALSWLYVGGMYLNDAFDREIDAIQRPERPIPSGAVRATTVFALGFGMLMLGIALAGFVGVQRTHSLLAAGCAIALAALIVLYNRWHKGNPLSPLLMGLCRVLVYVTAACATAGTRALTLELVLACGALLGYLIGLTYIAKHESGGSVVRLWPLLPLLAPIVYGALATSGIANALAFVLLAYIALTLRLVFDPARRNVPGAVARFIAGISLLDALVIAEAGAPLAWIAFAIAAFVVTRLLQRVVPGT